MTTFKLTLSVLPLELSVAQWPAAAELPALKGEFFSLTRTPGELSLVCETRFLAPEVRHEAGWRAFRLHGPFEFTLTGLLVSVLEPLRAAGIGIFALSTYDTDYVLVKESHLTTAIAALRGAGHTVHP
ncbi:ACT domain-containing protein [Deinococcus sp.]|uniref:ACT domain-containing protein n=1 Tax=Deinococcus sp. TaxID=47478 RepID=UPI003CC6B627